MITIIDNGPTMNQLTHTLNLFPFELGPNSKANTGKILD